jgi:methyl-accepting chemotaxis protein
MGEQSIASGEDVDEMGITVQGRADSLDDPQNDMRAWQQQLVQRVLRVMVGFGALIVVAASYAAYIDRAMWQTPLYLGGYAVLVLLTFWRGISHVLRAGMVLVVGYGLGIVALAGRGLGVVGEFYLLVVPVFALFWFGRREGVVALVLSTLTLLVFAWAFSTGRLAVSVQEGCDYASVSTWISPTLTFLLLGALLLVCGDYMLTRLSGALDQSRRSSQQREMDRARLEERVQVERATVQKYVDYMADVADGNLWVRLALDGSSRSHGEGWGRGSFEGDEEREADDPLILLGHQLNETTASLERMIRQIHEAANNLSSAAAEILAVTTQQSAGANGQAAAIAQTATTVDELKTIAEQSVARAQEVAGVSQRTVKVSRTGRQVVEETVGSMRQIRARVEGIAENILALSEQAQQVGEIIDTVNEISAQSNILALNASVEAARAGEYGKGFSVVAVEVRNLAEQSRQATAQVRAILSDIQKATNATVMATEEGTKQVEEGMRLASQAGESIEQLAGVIEESAQAATQMVAGGRQQAAGVEQVAVVMQNIRQATVQSLGSTRQSERAARELNDLARSLTEIVERYQI